MRDVSEADQRWPSLTPYLDVYTSNEGHSQELIMLRGTVPIVYRGASYNIPVQVVVMHYHPSGPPIMHVKPTADMEVKQRHDHVDRNGQVYLPYLTNWYPARSSLVGAISAMIDVFSRIPPVYSRPADERVRLLKTLTSRVKTRLTEISEEATTDAAKLLSKRDGSETMSIAKNVHSLRKEEKKLHDYIIQNRVREGNIDVDTMIHPRDLHSEQVMQCLAKDSALQDALAQVEDARLAGQLDIETCLRETSRLARDQFYARALLRKVKMHQAHANSAKHDKISGCD